MSYIDVSFLDRNNLFAGIVNKLSQKTALQKQMIVFLSLYHVIYITLILYSEEHNIAEISNYLIIS